MITPRIQNIAHKFLNPLEKDFFNDDYKEFLDQWNLKDKVYTEYLTLMWSAKEAIYKWHGDGGVDFRIGQARRRRHQIAPPKINSSAGRPMRKIKLITPS